VLGVNIREFLINEYPDSTDFEDVEEEKGGDYK